MPRPRRILQYGVCEGGAEPVTWKRRLGAPMSSIGQADYGIPRPRRSQRAQEHHDVRFFSGGEFGLEDEVEELDRVFQREQTSVVQVGWRLFDSAQGKRLDGSICTSFATVDGALGEEPFDLQIVHGQVGIIWRHMTGGTLGL